MEKMEAEDAPPKTPEKSSAGLAEAVSSPSTNSDVEMMEEGSENEERSPKTTPTKGGGNEVMGPPKLPVTPATTAAGAGMVTPTNSNGTPGSSRKRKKLTPDERAARDKERELKKQKLEEERVKKEEEKKKKDQERAEKAKAKEQEKIEKEKQREQEKLEREKERLKKEEERKKKEEQKEQERIKKEEELAKKNEERKKKEEEKRKKEEEKEKERQREAEKKAKMTAKFSNFFVKSPAAPKVKTLKVPGSGSVGDPESDKENSNDSVPSTSELKIKTELIDPSSNSNDDVQVVLIRKPEVSKFCPFPFQIKSNMVVAPLLRREALTKAQRDSLDLALSSEHTKELNQEGTVKKWTAGREELIRRIKNKEIRKTGRTLQENGANEDVVMIPRVGVTRCRFKLLQFDENRRPAYWGTWKRKPVKVKGSKPWEKEEEVDYTIDSDDEWEDEPEDAEEIENSEGEEDGADDPAEGEPEDEEDEEGWMVPHGYLPENDEENSDLETIKMREQEFFRSLKEKVKNGIPFIQSEQLSGFRIIFPPKKIRRSRRAPKVPTEASTSYHKAGSILGMALPSDDEDDKDWEEKTAEEGESVDMSENGTMDMDVSESEESSGSSDEEFEDDPEEDLEFESLEVGNPRKKKEKKKTTPPVESPA